MWLSVPVTTTFYRFRQHREALFAALLSMWPPICVTISPFTEAYILLFLFLVGSLDSEESAAHECQRMAVPGVGRLQLRRRTVDLLILAEFGTFWRTGGVCCCLLVQ
jgi:hypothetical protein